MSKKLLFTTIILLLIGLTFWLSSTSKRNKEPKYRTEKVEMGDVTATVTATGTLSAFETVQVGSQVSGIISKIYVDFNSKVKKGQLIAELDPTSFQAQVDQRQADLERARVETRNSQIAFERSKNLLENKLLAQSEFDVASANLQSNQASVKQAEAALRQAVTNLSYTKIESPIDGVVVDRQYDIGQTVAASFQAPTLFTIAQDLTRMQVATNIDEADIGKIQVGSRATFNVDAFSERRFEGKISQVRLSTQVVQNVVTYPVLIDVANPKLELKPGMTANVTIPVDTKTGVMKVHNAALRFRPDPEDLAEPPGKEEKGTRRKESVVYTMDAEGKLKPVSVRTSITDGNFTAIESRNLKPGQIIVVGLTTSRAMESTGGMNQQQGGRRRGF
ncbi:efflux RND transporter periplasmic adaptor subunit [bacterium]|nr:efflux RND transporter periplasmic adaptor subunit [bacterium]